MPFTQKGVRSAPSGEGIFRLERERDVIGIVLVFLLLWIGLMVLLGVGATWLQGYVYSEPAGEMYWRAPAAATAITLVLAWWCFLDYRSPGDYPAIFDFSSKEETTYKELWAVKDGKKIHFNRRTEASTVGNRVEFRGDDNRPLFTHPEAIIVKDGDEEIRFEPDRDSQGKFKIEQAGSLRYTDPQGRVMIEGSIGSISRFRWGHFLGYGFLNLLLFAALFASFWLVLQFQWPHALGLAVVSWLVLAILVVSMLTTKVEEVARKQPPVSTSGGSPEP